MSEALPDGWQWASLSELVTPHGEMCDGDWVESKDQDPDGDVRLIQLADVGSGVFLDKSKRYLTTQKARKLNCTFLKPCDVLISRLGEPLGKTCLFPGLEQPCVTVVDVHIFRSGSANISHRWLVHALNSASVRGRIEAQSSGTTRKRITGKKLKGLKIPVPPALEQKRIASKIDELFSRIEEGERALERVQRLVERYRQSVLKAAVTGELTREWREKHKGKLESGEALLARILKARREAWEKSELGKMKAKGQKPANDNWKRKYKEPGRIVTDYLNGLPSGWVMVRVDAVGEVQLGRQRAPRHHRGDFMRPYLRVANVFEERIDLSDVMSMNFAPDEFHTYRLRDGDVLLNEGQSKELVGRPAIYHDELPGVCFTNTLVRFRATEAVLPEFALLVFLYYMKARMFERISKITTNIAHLGAARFAEMSFPIPSIQEQQEIIDRVAEHISNNRYLVEELRKQRQQVTAFRQSVLKSAFSGRLVRQDWNDEPASMLLERIAAERNGNSAKKAAPKRRKREMVTA